MPVIDFASLRKIIELESKKDYQNTAVIGGFDKFIRQWAEQSIGVINSRPLLAKFQKLHLRNPDYKSLSPEQRKGWLQSILSLADELEHVKTEKSQPTKKTAVKIEGPITKPRVIKTSSAQSLDASIITIKGISTALSARFGKLGVKTIRNLLYFFPNRHLDYSQLKTVSQLAEGEEESIVANVWETRVVMPGGRRSTEAIVGDETGNIRAMWFNNPYLAKTLAPNMKIVLSGRVKLFNGRLVFESPEWEPLEDKDLVHTGRLVPIYPLTEGLHQRQTRKLIKGVVDQYAGQITDFLPSEIKTRCQLMELPSAVSQAHYPDSLNLKDKARVRLAFDELFLLQLGVLGKKRDWQESQPGTSIKTNQKILGDFVKSLPFTLTDAQQKVLKEILSDMEKIQAMSRLLQGEVGSGKTVVATAALLMAVADGYQTALMAPTEILAEQHFATIHKLLSGTGRLQEQAEHLYSYSGILPEPLTIALLTGAIKPKEKKEIHKLIADGKIDIVIGTHAIIQKEVAFKRLGFAVVDEQHRFGVAQRSTLRQKGTNPHVLVMTATPIPRTLALTIYGDLDLSVIGELPPGRQVIKTKWLKPIQRESAYNFIRREVGSGHQAFIVCPLIEESESVQAKAAIAEYEYLSQEVFPNLQLGLLHGRMSAKDKEKTMDDFHGGKLDILVSTPVVEVGIDVPNATVMMVESADRFGLSQLHQFRGRVGRGEAQSYCMLLSQNPSDVGQERLSIIETVYDGFRLAEEDLRIRGPGEFFGTRQSGLPDLRMAKLSDVAILELARNEAEMLFAKDPHLKGQELSLLVKELARVWTTEAGEWS
ncbi:MAG: ATP-dependent DNA helicase RecG [Dehalococcoidales bacterium]|nr:ATP-dependent DNA helicase RecG [Dehalococcoidales bacterium]